MNLGSLFTTIGESGGQFADAKLLAYQTRIQKMLDDLSLKKGTLGLEEGQASLEDLKERTRRLKLQPDTEEGALREKINALRNVFKQAGYGDITEDDIRSKEGLPLSGGSQQEIKKNIEEGLGKLEPRMRAMVEPAIRSYMRTGQYDKALQVYTQVAEKISERPDKKIEVKTTAGSGMPYEIVDENAKSWRVSDPDMPPYLQAQVKEYMTAHTAGLKQQEVIEMRKNAEAQNRAMALMDAREQQKLRDEVFKVARRGISGHSFLKTAAQEVNEAELTGGKGTTSGDLMLTEGFMQLMFGVDPKALRGSTKTMEYLLKQGGWDDRAIAAMNSALTGGKLSQEVRKQILEAATRQVGVWDMAVTTNGAMVDDPKTKALVDRYLQSVNKGDDEAISDLGGKPH